MSIFWVRGSLAISLSVSSVAVLLMRWTSVTGLPPTGMTQPRVAVIAAMAAFSTGSSGALTAGPSPTGAGAGLGPGPGAGLFPKFTGQQHAVRPMRIAIEASTLVILRMHRLPEGSAPSEEPFSILVQCRCGQSTVHAAERRV